MEHRRWHQRGVVFITMALWLAAFLALAVIGIDVGRVAFTANEVQTVADIAATAGVNALVNGRLLTAITDAQSVVAQNWVDGQQASIAATDVILGHYDPTTAAQVPGCATGFAAAPPFNAVCAHAGTTVNNVMAAVLGQPTSTVRRDSTAAFKTLQKGGPGLPIALGDCINCYPTLCNTTPLKIYFGGSAADNGGWVGQSACELRQRIPAACASPSYTGTNCTYGSAPMAPVAEGDTVSLSNGNVVTLADGFNQLSCIGRQFLVPIVDVTCGTNFSSATVKGFAAVTVLGAFSDAGGKYLSVQPSFIDCRVDTTGICRAYALGGDCPQCGTGVISLIR